MRERRARDLMAVLLMHCQSNSEHDEMPLSCVCVSLSLQFFDFISLSAPEAADVLLNVINLLTIAASENECAHGCSRKCARVVEKLIPMRACVTHETYS